MGQSRLYTYGTLAGVLSWVADMVGRELDGSLVDSGQERLGEGDFAHDVFLESREQALSVRIVQGRGRGG